MAAFASSFPQTKWSSCSLSDLNTGFNRFNTDRCLSNLPTTSVGNSVSVNDIREGEKIYKSAAFNVPVAQGKVISKIKDPYQKERERERERESKNLSIIPSRVHNECIY